MLKSLFLPLHFTVDTGTNLLKSLPLKCNNIVNVLFYFMRYCVFVYLSVVRERILAWWQIQTDILKCALKWGTEVEEGQPFPGGEKRLRLSPEWCGLGAGAGVSDWFVFFKCGLKVERPDQPVRLRTVCFSLSTVCSWAMAAFPEHNITVVCFYSCFARTHTPILTFALGILGILKWKRDVFPKV